MREPTQSLCRSTFIVALGLSVLAIFQGGVCAQAPDAVASQTGLALQPSVASAQTAVTEIGDAVALSRRYEMAIRIYSTAPIKTPEIWNKMGISYEMMLNTQQAVRCYKESLKLDPGNPFVLNNLGTLYESTRDYGNADRMFRKALSINPHFARIYKNLGFSLVAQQKYEAGRAALERAIALDPKVFEDTGDPTSGSGAPVHERGAMFYYMAQACARIGQTGRAIEYLAISLNDGFVDPQQVAMDSNFAAIVRDPAFRQLLAQQQRSQ